MCVGSPPAILAPAVSFYCNNLHATFIIRRSPRTGYFSSRQKYGRMGAKIEGLLFDEAILSVAKCGKPTMTLQDP